MPLITCPDCKKKVSDKAPACIHCGCPLNNEDKSLLINEVIAENSSQRKATLVECRSESGGGKIQDIETEKTISFSPYEVVDKKLLKDYVNQAILYEKDNGRLKITGPSTAPINPFFERNSRNTSEPNLNSQSANVTRHDTDRVTKNYLWYLMVLVILAGYWISKGTPNPSLFFASSSAKEQCLTLAKENKGSSLIFNNDVIKAEDTWLKDGKRVVRLLQTDNNGSMNQIMCVVGNGMVQIPSLLEQGKWR